jgi:hypothetical protein
MAFNSLDFREDRYFVGGQGLVTWFIIPPVLVPQIKVGTLLGQFRVSFFLHQRNRQDYYQKYLLPPITLLIFEIRCFEYNIIYGINEGFYGFTTLAYHIVLKEQE